MASTVKPQPDKTIQLEIRFNDCVEVSRDLGLEAVALLKPWLLTIGERASIVIQYPPTKIIETSAEFFTSSFADQ